MFWLPPSLFRARRKPLRHKRVQPLSLFDRLARHGLPFPSLYWQGEKRGLTVTQDPNSPHSCTLTDEGFKINIPLPTLEGKDLAAEATLSLKLWSKKQAKARFETSLAFWCERLGVKAQKLTVTAPRARWGSCTWRDEIRLNWRLMQTPSDLLEYVVAHEACHILHKNHGAPFWREMEGVMPDCTERRKALRLFEKALQAEEESL